ncbi:hypothetical protein Atep_03740 [Allochromatium tepidum]|uniref:Radical SAM core domain-containing protein n=2 Tax=Allochromatium tepidum TaxID=553982 RepID=A0ABM7QIW0_9GAMM|nr:hypothetical protein Atep_03740 [Allochromatium tepidum]
MRRIRPHRSLVVLTGVHLGGYGSDLGTDLTHLIERLLNETAIPRLRLGSLEPWDLPERFWSLFADRRLMPHLHLPLQSGSDRVLRRMARRCKRDEYIRLVEGARAAIPDLNLTTDIIVGFPGEDDDDWRQTFELAESLRFGHIHVFGYSPHPGTPAAGFANPVDARTRRRRVGELESLAHRSRLQILRDQIGKTVMLLHERLPDAFEGRPRSGYTPNYLPVHVRSATPIGEGSKKQFDTGADHGTRRGGRSADRRADRRRADGARVHRAGSGVDIDAGLTRTLRARSRRRRRRRRFRRRPAVLDVASGRRGGRGRLAGFHRLDVD